MSKKDEETEEQENDEETGKNNIISLFKGIEKNQIALWGISAGTILMLVSMFAPKVDGVSATKDVLPFATGLIGFLAGLYARAVDKKPKAKNTNPGHSPKG